MYLPPQFSPKDASAAADLIREHPFASLISTDEDGLPFVSHLPLHLERARASDLVLLGHCAKPNPHWRYLQARPQAVVTFLGPHAYMSPKVYPDLARVPTWNYLAVHCTVQATLIEDPTAKDALLKKLIGDHEPAYAAQWRGLGEDFAHKMLAGIVGFELAVTRAAVQAQAQPAPAGIACRMRERYASGNENERALARWMDRLGMAAPATLKETRHERLVWTGGPAAGAGHRRRGGQEAVRRDAADRAVADARGVRGAGRPGPGARHGARAEPAGPAAVQAGGRRRHAAGAAHAGRQMAFPEYDENGHFQRRMVIVCSEIES